VKPVTNERSIWAFGWGLEGDVKAAVGHTKVYGNFMFIICHFEVYSQDETCGVVSETCGGLVSQTLQHMASYKCVLTEW